MGVFVVSHFLFYGILLRLVGKLPCSLPVEGKAVRVRAGVFFLSVIALSNRPHSNSDYNNEAVREKTFGCWSWKSFDPQKKRKQERKCVHLYFCDCIGSYRNRSLLRGNTARAQLIYGLHEIRAQCNEPKVIFFTPGVERW